MSSYIISKCSNTIFIPNIIKITPPTLSAFVSNLFPNLFPIKAPIVEIINVIIPIIITGINILTFKQAKVIPNS